MRKTKPFEIVFVVVVLVLAVGIFVPILFPRGERLGVRRSSCLSNVKQIGLGLKQYSQDYGDRYPWRVGATDPANAWLDLGLVFPNYCSAFRTFFCPSAKDRSWDISDKYSQGPLDPFTSTSTAEVISYSYGINAADPENPTAWTENAPATVRLIADKKAGTAIGDSGNPARLANHRDDGRNVLYEDGHVRWKAGGAAVDPDEEDDDIGDPSATDYRRWWSDPPYYGE